jgi:TonB-linked SusC/RagA family outer membrane protein
MKKTIFLFLMAAVCSLSAAFAQDAPQRKAALEGESTTTVTGKVISDIDEAALPGVSVSVMGMPYSAMTGDDGTFTLKVPESKECQLRIDGPQVSGVIVSLRKRDDITVRLQPAGYTTMTNQMVLTPLGMKEKSYLTSAVSVVSEDNALSVKGTPEQLLQGKVAGLNVLQRDGADASGANMYLRGFNSIYASNQPLLVIDGMIIENAQFGTSLIEGQVSTPLGSIDVKDIDQMTVLKDATAIYGAKGANGAILIQTRRVTDQKTKVDITALVGMNMQPKSLPVLNAADSKRYLQDVAQTSGLSPRQITALDWVNANQPVLLPNGTYQNENYWKYNQNTDWQEEIFQRAFKQQYSLAVSGGDETAVYGVSVGFAKKDGVIKGTDYTRFNARLNAAIDFTKAIRFQTNMQFLYGEKNIANQGSASVVNPLYTALVKAPFTAIRSISPENVASTAYENYDAMGNANPAVVVSDLKSLSSNYRFLGSYKIEADLYKGLTLATTFGVDFAKEREEIFYPTTGIPYGTLPLAEITNVQMHRVERLFTIFDETTLNYLWKHGHHTLDATLGFRYRRHMTEDDFGRGYNSASNYYQTISSGNADLYQNGGAIGTSNWLSFYGNVDYSWKNRYFLSAVLSSDASSRYGDNVSTFQVYPGVSAAWLISDENWMDIDAFNFLKLRASWSQSGNDDLGNYTSRRYYLSKRFLTSNGLVRGNLMNEDLKPERVQKFNVGLDMGLVNERLNISVDYYNNRTRDMLLYALPARFSGFASYVGNGGEMQNQGVEVAVGGRLAATKHFTWDVNLTLAHNHNTVKKLSTGDLYTTIGDGQVLTTEGESLGIFYGYRTNGVYSTANEAAAAGLSTMNGALRESFQAGDVRFLDQNGDKLIDDNDRVKIGDPNPDFFGGISSVMKFYGFTVTAEFGFSVGNDIYNYTRSVLESQKDYINQTKAVLNRWRTEGDVTDMPRASYGDPHGNSRFSDRWIEDGSYFKMKTASIAYDIPIKSNFITGLTVFGTCENVFTLTDYKGYDPEIICSSSNNPLYTGVDAFTTPTQRTFYVGVKLGL